MESLPVTQIKVTETVLGKGAFGEVRVARWRNLDVAYKRLHVLQENDENRRHVEFAPREGEQQNDAKDEKSDDNENVEEVAQSKNEINQEIEMLSKLRHPNLLLFLGTTKEATSPQPCIITELMSYSLYDLLEVHKINLSLPDILDIALDISNGLDYLHKYNPSIIHRDISSKNILLNGKHAKIADLGQAKIFHASTMSKQTGIPGAMAYSAPEVLTGKYSTKIDIFSFGILLCQMCHNQYPRIDRRQEQIDLAREQYPILSNIIQRCLQFHPNERPDASDIGIDLLTIMENDRYYPISRHMLPEKDLGILGYHLFTKKMQVQYTDIITKNETLNKLLTIEETRWKQEAAKVDQLAEEKQSILLQLQQEEAKNQKARLEIQQSQQEKQQAIEQQHQYLLQINILSSEIQSLQSNVQTLETQAQQKDSSIQQKQQELTTLRQQHQEQLNKHQQQTQQYEQLQQKFQLTNKQLSMQVEYCKDLEGRLEQVLNRWKEEKEFHQHEKSKNVSLQSLVAQLMQQKEQLTIEYQRCDVKLRQYEGLPMPEEIKLRFTDLQKENDLLREKIQSLIVEKEEIIEKKEQVQRQYDDQAKSMRDVTDQIQQKDSFIKTKEMEILQLQSTIAQQKKTLEEKERNLKENAKEKEQLHQDLQELDDKVKMLSNELTQEKKIKAQLSLKVQQLALVSSTSTPASPTVQHNPLSAFTLSNISSDNPAADPDSNPANNSIEENTTSSMPNETNAPTNTIERLSEVAIKHLIERTVGRQGVKGLIDLILNNTHDDRILWRALRSIRELIITETANTTNSNRDIIQQTNPEIWLVELFIKQYPRNRMIMSQVMRFIGTFSFGNDVFRRKIGERQIMVYIIESFKAFPNDEMVLLHTTMALTNLTHGSKENRSRFSEAGGILILIQLMYQQLSNQKLQMQFCWSLLTLSGSDEIAVEISQQKGDLLVIQSILTHKEDASIQEYGLWTLYNLCLASPDIATMLKGKGLLELCQIAVENHTGQTKVMQQVQNIKVFFEGNSSTSNLPPPATIAAARKKPTSKH